MSESSDNFVKLKGRICQPPYFSSEGKAFASIHLETADTFTAPDGKVKTKKRRHVVVFFGELAHQVNQSAHRDLHVKIWGELDYVRWQNDETKTAVYTPRIISHGFQSVTDNSDMALPMATRKQANA